MFFPPLTLYNDILSHLVARSKKNFDLNPQGEGF
jgi:hypothetical protein